MDCISESFICASPAGLCERVLKDSAWMDEGSEVVLQFAHVCPGGCAFYERAMKFVGFSGGSVVKSPPANAGDSGSIPGSGRSPGKDMATHPGVLIW